MRSPRILVVDDEQGIREQLLRWLTHEGFRTEQAATARAALAAVRKANFNVILLDLKLPDMDGFELLEKLHHEYPDICIIVLTGFGTEESPAKARQFGAYDFFAKPVQFESLIHRIDTAVQRFKEQREHYYQGEEAKRQFQFENIIGESPAMQGLFETIRRIAETDETILIQGENGTGKNLVAGAIHYNSARKAKPLIMADCTGLPETLAESELFGHEKGAFTNAIARKSGKFERAHSTTLFVDEIGVLSPFLQMKFLRFLQEKTFERVGGSDPIEVDVRIIAATNVNLTEAVKQRKFREDLFHRLSRIVITVPPLRERRLDIPLLADHFIKRFNRLNGKAIEGISRPALHLLEHYHFPGNVRELENMIASAILFEESHVLQPESIRSRLMAPVADSHPSYQNLSYREARRLFEKAYCTQLLQATHGNISQAARLAGLDRSHLREKMKTLGLLGEKASDLQDGSEDD